MNLPLCFHHRHGRTVLMSISEQDWKVLLALAGTVTGWLLAQGAATAKFFWRRRWLRKHLLIELEDVKAELQQALLHYGEMIQVATAVDGGIFPRSRMPIEAPIYASFFSEAYSALNRSQRVSYKTTHAAVRAVNDGFEVIRDFLHGLDAGSLTREQLKKREAEWMDLLKAHYLNAHFAYAHVHYHLNNRKRPELGDPYGRVAQWFGEQDVKAADRIQALIESAAGKKVEELPIHMAGRKI
jgi:hypothetical protein